MVSGWQKRDARNADGTNEEATRASEVIYSNSEHRAIEYYVQRELRDGSVTKNRVDLRMAFDLSLPVVSALAQSPLYLQARLHTYQQRFAFLGAERGCRVDFA